MRNKNILFFVLLVTIFSASGSLPLRAQVQVEDRNALFAGGNAAYREGSYDEAVELYEKVRERGYESGALYYNLGNSYFRSGQIGKAMLNYQRAKRLLPRDGDVKANLRYCATLIPGYPGNSGRTFLGAVLDSYQKEITSFESAMMFLGLLLLFCSLITFARWRKWGRLKTLVLAGVIISGLIFQGVLVFQKDLDHSTLAVLVTETEARYEPSDSATVYFDLAQGIPVAVIDEERGWIKIKRHDGKVGWVAAGTLERI